MSILTPPQGATGQYAAPDAGPVAPPVGARRGGAAPLPVAGDPLPCHQQSVPPDHQGAADAGVPHQGKDQGADHTLLLSGDPNCSS